MPRVKNTTNQPLYLNLPRGKSLKIAARGSANVDQADMESPALTFHLSRGNVVVIEETQPVAGQ